MKFKYTVLILSFLNFKTLYSCEHQIKSGNLSTKYERAPLVARDQHPEDIAGSRVERVCTIKNTSRALCCTTACFVLAMVVWANVEDAQYNHKHHIFS